MKAVRIGELAAKTGLTVKTIRPAPLDTAVEVITTEPYTDGEWFTATRGYRVELVA